MFNLQIRCLLLWQAVKNCDDTGRKVLLRNPANLLLLGLNLDIVDR